MSVYILKSTDPFEREKEIHREEVRHLNAEIIRLKIKCKEAFTADELLIGFGDPPRLIFESEEQAREHGELP